MSVLLVGDGLAIDDNGRTQHTQKYCIRVACSLQVFGQAILSREIYSVLTLAMVLFMTAAQQHVQAHFIPHHTRRAIKLYCIHI